MMDMTTKKIDPLYNIILLWNPYRDSTSYKKYCAETLCNILGFTPGLSVKIIYEASEKTRALVYSTWNIDKATNIRNDLLSLGIDTVISKVQL
jgi:hypothetical protein